MGGAGSGGEALLDDFLCFGLVLFLCFMFGRFAIRIFTVLHSSHMICELVTLRENPVVD